LNGDKIEIYGPLTYQLHTINFQKVCS